MLGKQQQIPNFLKNDPRKPSTLSGHRRMVTDRLTGLLLYQRTEGRRGERTEM